MALPVTIPNAFANATASIPLSQLDTNFNTLANAVNGISDGSETLANVTATVGNITTVNATTVDTTNIEVTNIKAKDGTAAVVLTDSTGAVAVSTPLTANGGVVFNDAGADVDFRVEGDTDANLLFVDAGNDRVGVKTATPAVALDVVGQVRASTGILFGSDTAAANALDDYEEGTWTPTYFGGITAGTLTGTVYGYYTKIGRQVTVVGRLDNVTLTGASGNFSIGGLPFTIANLTRNEGSGAFSFYNVNFNTSYLYSLIGTPNTTALEILASVDGAAWSGLPVDNASSIYMIFTFTYFA